MRANKNIELACQTKPISCALSTGAPRCRNGGSSSLSEDESRVCGGGSTATCFRFAFTGGAVVGALFPSPPPPCDFAVLRLMRLITYSTSSLLSKCSTVIRSDDRACSAFLAAAFAERVTHAAASASSCLKLCDGAFRWSGLHNWGSLGCDCG